MELPISSLETSKDSYLLSSKLPLARYRFTAQVQAPLELPHFAGSLLRGQFGAALRNLACMTRQPTCHGCPLLQTCPYTRIFEAPPPPKRNPVHGTHAQQDFSQIPQPYVMEPPAPGVRLLATGDLLEFHMVLVGTAIDQLALVLFAVQRALQQGLTRQRIPAELQRVDWLDTHGQAQPIWSHDQPTLAEHRAEIAIPPAPSAIDTITLHIHTPLRLQSQGKPLGVGQLNPRALVAAVARRTSLLMEFHAEQSGWGEAGKAVAFLSDTLTDEQQLKWYDWTRYSSRQQQEMTLGGVMGRWSLHGSPDALASIWPWLWLGQWLHVGKNATMGMGGYRLGSAV